MSGPDRAAAGRGEAASPGAIAIARTGEPAARSRLVDSIERLLDAGTMPFRLIGAHDALSARLGEEAGFDGIWAGSLEVSASHAVPDTGSLPIHEMAERVGEMAGSVSLPVLVDVDAGLEDLRRTVTLIEAIGAAGMALEDKHYPKFNSLSEADHRLQTIDSFRGRLAAAMGFRSTASFAIIARVEALTSGGSVDDAVARARAYAGAGVDAVIVHSRSATGEDVIAAMSRLSLPIPVGVIPTRFPGRSAASLREAGASFVIYANQGIRAEIEAVRSVFDQIERLGSSEDVEAQIATVEDVFELQARAAAALDHRNGHARAEREVDQPTDTPPTVRR
jgi:phosphoenolpyruvate phosphomutase